MIIMIYANMDVKDSAVSVVSGVLLTMLLLLTPRLSARPSLPGSRGV